jgi:hypothetical protein
MRTLFLTTLCATAIGFSTLTTARPQSIAVAPAASRTNVTNFSKAGFGAMAKMNKTKKSKINWGVSIDGVKRDDSWFKEMRDPCQVEG